MSGMARYETSKTSSDFNRPPRGLGAWTSIAGIVVATTIMERSAQFAHNLHAVGTQPLPTACAMT
jgi:hypothetical protein